MKIAIIGAGNVGKTLGNRFAENGHEIFYGVRNPEEFEDLNGKFVTNKKACESAEFIFLAVPFDAIESAIKSCGDLSDKIIVDVTNPLAFDGQNLNLTLGFETSGAEKIAKISGSEKVVKCFNQTGFNIMENPKGSMMFVCGNDLEANETIKNLATEIGYEAITIGDITKSRLLEPLAMLWIHLAGTTELKRDFVFKISKV
jgi:predicted dinucleotide-binding enzyme